MSGMFCYQCEQAAQCTGCTTFGVCGKDPRAAALQDLILYAAKGVGQYASRMRDLGIVDSEIDAGVVDALFTTVTNVNFDVPRLADIAISTFALRDKAGSLYEGACQDEGQTPADFSGPASFEPANGIDALVEQGQTVGIVDRRERLGDDVTGLQELLAYGIKGAAAYADHAEVLGYKDDGIYAFFHKALRALADEEADVQTLIELNMECGKANLRTMELLDQANTDTYGHPEPTPVRVTPVAGKSILVSGHDLKDLAELLEQTVGKGINVYTHGEMLPCHAYPELKKYDHLVGNYGGAWQDQHAEFDAFPGAILMTTNCLQKPRDSYRGRIFTTGLVGFDGVEHVANGQFGAVIDAALAAPGFASTEEEKTILVGFGRNAVLGVADKVIDAVKAGAVRHFFLVGGCDGAKSGRNYYTDFAEQVPDDCVILTLACGKYRFNKLEFGDIGGIPRLLDIGQCNDAYSAIKIALALADAFDCGVNDLPLSLVLSWYEQKAVAILLTLLSLGVQGIRLGPTLPAFVTPTVLGVLVETFGVAPTTTADADLTAILGD